MESTENETLAPASAVPPLGGVQIPERLYFRIGDVAELTGVKPYVLRFWETEFPMIAPEKSKTGQRVYRRIDVETILMIKHLLYSERYSIEGARRKIKELRKDGELGAFKREIAKLLTGGSESPQPAVPAVGIENAREERMRKIHVLASELRSLTETPIDQVFRL